MTDRLFIKEYMEQFFEEVEPKDFYRNIFPEGELEAAGKQEQGKYNALAVELLPIEKDKINARRYILNNDLDIMDNLLESDNFIIISPISYIGRSRKAENARYIYALAIDLDGVERLPQLRDLFHQINNVDYLPKPTYIVWSGQGLHLYYQFKKPIPCFRNITKQLQVLKNALTKKIWNGFVTSLEGQVQIQSLFQGFRMVGGVTKGGHRTAAYLIGEKIDIDYLNSFVDEKSQVKEMVYKSSLTLKEAQEKYPEWYQKRIVEKKPKGVWICKEAVYQWWLNELKAKIEVGHRYYAVMVLAIYAKKCGVSREQLEQDAFGLFDFLEAKTTEENNHFKREDILAALELYNDNYFTFPIDTITQLTDIHIEKNKRNFRKQAIHLERARAVQKIDYPEGEWRNKEGRPTKAELVKEWRKLHPLGTKAECKKELNISLNTVKKWWGDN